MTTFLFLLLAACGDETETATSADETATPVDTGTPTAHDVVVPPNLQSVGPTDAWVLWETSSGTGSTVEYGLTDALGVTVRGVTTEDALGTMHEVHLDSLIPDTLYWYVARTGLTESDAQSFRTPPAASDPQPFQLVAMSDMQRSDANPDKWAEVVRDGVVPFVTDRYDPSLPDAVAFVLLAGDLVDTGWNQGDWTDEFFPGAAPLMGQVPLYPVYGNHETATPLLARYFHLSDNGPEGAQDHTWSFDRGNVRVIGLDSNEGFRDAEQLGWLDSVLTEACTLDTIEFVFVELHHPWLSELWPTGELDFTGDVVTRLESFTTGCGKPSIHFFGHTHGYSRGQSRDHRHLWVNVATAGGGIDRWGGDDEVDYDEFSVSQDHYGFVVVEVEAGAFTLRRVSMGTPETPLDNEITDEIRVTLDATPPRTPAGVSPVDGATVSAPITLQASAFAHDSDGAHGASHWQVATDCSDFSAPAVDRWVQHENWWRDVDTQAGDDLTDIVLESSVLESTDLTEGAACWRVRYRDRGLSWSDWSSPAQLIVGVSGR